MYTTNSNVEYPNFAFAGSVPIPESILSDESCTGCDNAVLIQYLVRAKQWFYVRLPMDGMKSVVFRAPSPTLCVASGECVHCTCAHYKLVSLSVYESACVCVLCICVCGLHPLACRTLVNLLALRKFVRECFAYRNKPCTCFPTPLRIATNCIRHGRRKPPLLILSTLSLCVACHSHRQCMV